MWITKHIDALRLSEYHSLAGWMVYYTVLFVIDSKMSRVVEYYLGSPLLSHISIEII